MFSMRGAYVDDDGIQIGSNDVSEPRRGAPERSHDVLASGDLRRLVYALAVGVALALGIVLWYR